MFVELEISKLVAIQGRDLPHIFRLQLWKLWETNLFSSAGKRW